MIWLRRALRGAYLFSILTDSVKILRVCEHGIIKTKEEIKNQTLGVHCARQCLNIDCIAKQPALTLSLSLSRATCDWHDQLSVIFA